MEVKNPVFLHNPPSLHTQSAHRRLHTSQSTSYQDTSLFSKFKPKANKKKKKKMLPTKENIMRPKTSPPPVFPRFPDLPAELQAMIIKYALASEMAQRENKLIIRFLPRIFTKYKDIGKLRPMKEKKKSSKRTANIPTPPVQLPRLPAIYHVSRVCRGEALRSKPTHQLFSDDGCKALEYRLGSKLLFNQARDTVVINLRNRRPEGKVFDTLLDNVFDMAKRAARSSSLNVAFVMCPTTRSCARRMHEQILGNVDRRYPQYTSVIISTLVREKGTLIMYQLAMNFNLHDSS